VEIADLLAQVRGNVLTPSHANYDLARKMWNGMVDQRPALIVQCIGTADVVAALDYARSASLPVRVRGGGHSVAGLSTGDGFLVIDLSLMRSVIVDAANKTARVSPGTQLGDLDAETQLYGLAVPAGVDSRTGVAGLTLGGGQGFLSRSFGITADNLIGAEVVLADGTIRQVDAEHEEDLFWALRGGSAGVGVVTSFEFQLHEVGPEVAVAQAFYPAKDARQILRSYRDFMDAAPDSIAVYALCVPVPSAEPFPESEHGNTAIALVGCSARDVSEGIEQLKPLVAFGEPLFSMLEAMPYRVLQDSFTDGAPDGGRYFWKSNYLKDLPDGVIDVMSEYALKLPGPYSNFFIEPLGGAISRVAEQATPFPHRDARYSFGISSGWEEPAQDSESIAWTRRFHEAVTPFATGRYYVNYMDHDESSSIGAAFGGNYERLQAIRQRYDPEGLFG
jgi:FAD/FMN-containing dehydrogenase